MRNEESHRSDCLARIFKTIVPCIPVFLCLALLASCVNDDEDFGDGTMLVRVGDLVPDFVLTDADGEDLAPETLEGQVYILNFFDTRCSDCQKELRVLQQVHEKYLERVPILNVPRSETKEEIQAYWEQAGLTLPFYLPEEKDLYYRFATKTIPRTYVVDGNGKVIAAFSDAPIADFATLDALLQKQLGDVADDQKAVNLSLRVKVANRSIDMEEYYFHNEYTISRLDVYFFDAETKEFATKAIINDLTQEDAVWNTEYDVTYLYDRIRLKVGLYDIFAIANYDYAPSKVEDEMELLNMVDSLTYKDGIEANIPDKGPVMTNRASSLLSVDFVPWADKEYVLSIELERAVAKLQIGVAQNAFQLTHNRRKYAEINITNYKLVNLTKQYYLFQHKDYLPDFEETPEFVLPDNFGDDQDAEDVYVVDPLFYKKTPNTTDADFFNKYYKSWFGSFSSSIFASMPAANNYGYAYILENTAYKTSQKNGYSPGIVFKAAVNPVFVYLYDANQRTLKEENRPEYWPKTIYLYNYNFYGSIQTVNIASGLTLDELETYTDAQLKPYGIKQCKFNMGVYETYYTYWIHHRSHPTDPMGTMEYGIVRNNFYRMLVTGINGVGNSVITPEVLRDNYPNSYVDVVVK